MCIYTHTHICVCIDIHTYTLDTYAQSQYASVFWGNGLLPLTTDGECHVDKLHLQAVFGNLFKLTGEM